MAHERRCERAGNDGGTGPRLRRLALACLIPLLASAAGCDSGTGPTGPGAPAGPGPDVGIVTDLPSPLALVGAWVRDDEIEHRGTAALQSTEWRFDGRGTCRLTITLYTIDTFTPFVDDSVCTYRADGRTITLHFGTGDVVRMRWEPDGRDGLVLSGERYDRFRG
jgi:hypothetical protein